MRTNDPLRLPLSLAAAYALLAGIVLLFPTLSEAVFGRPVVDPAVEGLYGVALVTLGAIFAVLVGQKHRTSALLWAQVGGLVLGAVVMIAYWTMGEFMARTILAPILINLILAGWIASQMSKAAAPSTQVTRA